MESNIEDILRSDSDEEDNVETKSFGLSLAIDLETLLRHGEDDDHDDDDDYSNQVISHSSCALPQNDIRYEDAMDQPNTALNRSTFLDSDTTGNVGTLQVVDTTSDDKCIQNSRSAIIVAGDKDLHHSSPSSSTPSSSSNTSSFTLLNALACTSTTLDPRGNSLIDSRRDNLFSLIAAERREQRFLQAGGREIVSALQSRRLGRTATTSLVSNAEGGGAEFKLGSPELVQSRLNLMNAGETTIQEVGSNIKCLELEVLSTQLKRNANYKQHGPGIATSIFVNQKFIAVGTSKGLILLFDHDQEIRHVIGSSVTPSNRSIASITAIDVNRSGNLLASGYVTGEVALWDIPKNSLLKRVTDLHQFKITRLSILHIPNAGAPSTNLFTGVSNDGDIYALSADIKGIVHKQRFSKILWTSYVSDSECLLDGSAGPVLDMGILPPASHYFNKHNLLQDVNVNTLNESISQFVAFNSTSRSYIVQLHPNVKVIYRWLMPPLVKEKSDGEKDISSGPVVPSIDWGWFRRKRGTIAAQCAGARDSDSGPLCATVVPILARSWGKFVQLLEITSAALEPSDPDTIRIASSMVSTSSNSQPKDSDDVKCQVIAERCFTIHFVALKWVSPSRLAVMSASELVFLSQSLDIMERCTLQPKVSACLRAAVEDRVNLEQPLPCILSVTNGRIYSLAPESLYTFHSQSWIEIADQLIRGGQWLEALSLALDNNTKKCNSVKEINSFKNVMDETGDIDDQSNLHIDRYILNYVKLAMSQSVSTSSSKIPGVQLRNHHSLVAGVCIEYCHACDRLSLLFGSIFDAFVAARQEIVFHESLEPHIYSRRIPHLPPHIVSSMINASSSSPQRLAALERCIAYLDLSQVDLDLLARFSLQQKMYSSFLYIYSYGLTDFCGAFETIFNQMMTSGSSDMASFPSPAQADIGYKLLLFIHYAIDGKIFPRGDDVHISTDKVVELIERVLSREYASKPNLTSSGIKFPYMSVLSKIDTPATMYCVANGLKFLTSLNGSPGLFRDGIDELFNCFYDFSCFTDQVNPRGEAKKIFFESCMPMLVDVAIPLSFEVLVHLVKSSASCVYPHMKAEDLVTKLLSQQIRVGNMIVLQLRDVLIENNFWRAMLIVQGGRRHNGYNLVADFDLALTAYLDSMEDENPVSKEEVFVVIDAFFHSLDLEAMTEEQSNDFHNGLCKFLLALASIDLDRTKALVCKFMTGHCTNILEATKKSPLVQFELIRALIKSISAEEKEVKDIAELFTPIEVLSYIHLLLSFAPQDVFPFVSSCDHYPLDDCLLLCKEHGGVADATAWLLEKSGEVHEALQLLLDEFTNRILIAKKVIEIQLRVDISSKNFEQMPSLHLTNIVASEKSIIYQVLGKHGEERLEAVTRLQSFDSLSHILNCCIGLCSRNGSNDITGTQMWFSTFDFLLRERFNLRNATISSTSEVLLVLIGQLLQYFMSQMKSHVPAQEIIRRLTLSGQGYASGTPYEEFKDVFASMIDSYAWDKVIHENVVAIHFTDLHGLHQRKMFLKVSIFQCFS